MNIAIDKERCMGEGICVELCDHGVLALKDDKAAVVNLDACTFCRGCEVACEYGALHIVE